MIRLIIFLTLFIASCTKDKPSDPLTIPPNFAAKPDLNNPEKITEEQKDQDIVKIKDLLLKSE